MTKSIEKKFEQVKALYETESKERKIVVRKDELPHSYDLISDEWLTNILCGHASGIEVSRHSLDEADEGVTNRRRIFIEYNNAEAAAKAGLPSSVFCKASQTLSSRFIVGLLGVAENEVTFYNTIRPKLDIEAPESVFANADPVSLNSMVMLKDMGSEVEFAGHDMDISRARAESQLALLAKLHGRYYESPELDTTFNCYGTVEDFFHIMREASKIDQACSRALTKATHCIPERLLSQRDQVWPAVEQSFLCHQDLPRTLVHNDAHLKNWYARPNDVMGLNDWQTCAKGHWSRDVGYVLATSLTIENRRLWEKELLAYYLEQLEKNDGNPESFDRAFDLYRMSIPGSLVMWLGALTPEDDAPRMQPEDSCLEFITRMYQAWDDLDVSACFN